MTYGVRNATYLRHVGRLSNAGLFFFGFFFFVVVFVVLGNFFGEFQELPMGELIALAPG